MPSREEVGRAILIAKDATSTPADLAAVAPVLADALLLAPSDEHARLRALAQLMVDRHVELGRARDADRWRAFNEWLRVNAP
jgi:hypothetical protein